MKKLLALPESGLESLGMFPDRRKVSPEILRDFSQYVWYDKKCFKRAKEEMEALFYALASGQKMFPQAEKRWNNLLKIQNFDQVQNTVDFARKEGYRRVRYFGYREFPGMRFLTLDRETWGLSGVGTEFIPGDILKTAAYFSSKGFQFDEFLIAKPVPIVPRRPALHKPVIRLTPAVDPVLLGVFPAPKYSSSGGNFLVELGRWD